jgi:hypothetical protein
MRLGMTRHLFPEQGFPALGEGQRVLTGKIASGDA